MSRISGSRRARHGRLREIEPERDLDYKAADILMFDRIDPMSLATIDLALRAATVALLLVLAAAFWRDFRHVAAGRLTIALALGTIAHALTSQIGSTAPVSVWHAPLI